MEGKKGKSYKKISILFIFIFLFTLIFNNPLMVKFFNPVEAENGNVAEAWHNTSQLTVSVVDLRPQIMWYGFQYWNYSNGWESRLNQQIDVNDSAKYRFVVNITSYQGWDDIEYVNFSAWYDNGSETSYYNQTNGGNFNMKLQYENTTGNANYTLLWPDNEVSLVSYSEKEVVNSYTDWPYAESKNITFEFIPSYQIRYAPGPEGVWDMTNGGLICTNESYLNNHYSWNFNITVTDSGKNNSGLSKTSWVADEFGVYSYSEIVSAGNPVIYGEPNNQNYSVNDQDGSGNVTIITRSNGNYTLSSNLSDLIHGAYSEFTISNESVSLRGGNRTTFSNFSKGSSSHPVFLYGGSYDSMPAYQPAEPNDNNKITDNIEYRCFIEYGKMPGSYTSTVYYTLRTYQ